MTLARVGHIARASVALRPAATAGTRAPRVPNRRADWREVWSAQEKLSPQPMVVHVGTFHVERAAHAHVLDSVHASLHRALLCAARTHLRRPPGGG